LPVDSLRQSVSAGDGGLRGGIGTRIGSLMMECRMKMIPEEGFFDQFSSLQSLSVHQCCAHWLKSLLIQPSSLKYQQIQLISKQPRSEGFWPHLTTKQTFSLQSKELIPLIDLIKFHLDLSSNPSFCNIKVVIVLPVLPPSPLRKLIKSASQRSQRDSRECRWSPRSLLPARDNHYFSNLFLIRFMMQFITRTHNEVV
jgi:hypothetical protein